MEREKVNFGRFFMLTQVSIKILDDYITAQEQIRNIQGRVLWDAVGKIRSLLLRTENDHSGRCAQYGLDVRKQQQGRKHKHMIIVEWSSAQVDATLASSLQYFSAIFTCSLATRRAFASIM